MKKKIVLSALCCLSVLLVATGCGNQTSNENNNTNNNQNNVENNTNNSNVDENDIIDLLVSAFKVPGENIYVNYPEERKNSNTLWNDVELGFTQYWHIGHEMFITFTFDKNSTATDLNTAHKLAVDKLINNFENKYLNYFTITSDEQITINGIEMYKFIGKVNYGNDTKQDKYAIGYSFIMNGIPCNITGFLYKADETDENINEITETVSAMAQTVRTTR